MYKAVITGVGGYVPDYILTNEELSTIVDTNDEWIVTRTGIKERRILKEGATSTLASKAITANVRSEGSLIVLMLRRKKPVPFRLIVLLRNLPVPMLDWLYHLMERRFLTETDFVPSSVAVTVTF